MVLLLILVIMGLPIPAASQDGSGVIFEGGVTGSQNIGPLNPLLCDNPACQRVTDLLFPHLVGIDPAAGVFTQSGDSTALAAGWVLSADGRQIRFQLRQDMTWSDGVPITAYDVFYSYLALVSSPATRSQADRVRPVVAAAVPLDAATILFTLRQPNCSALNALNLTIIPAHVYTPGFADRAQGGLSAVKLLLGQFKWSQGETSSPVSLSRRAALSIHPAVTAGVFDFEGINPAQDVRLSRADGQLAYALVDVPDRRTEVAQFLNGDLNLIVNPPLDQRADIRAAADVQVFETPGTTWDGIALNLADPNKPKRAGEEQGHHPLFGDLEVRRAMQLGIDRDALIEAAVLGSGTIIAANQPPTSWAFNLDLTPAGYDPAEARRLLEQAGWKDTNRDGIRECWGCAYGKQGMWLEFELMYSYAIPRHAIMAELLRDQLALVGFSVKLNDGGGDLSPGGLLRQQRFDAYLFERVEDFPVNPDQWAMFSQANDQPGMGWNVGSYDNPDVERLLAEARTLPGCDLDARTEKYQDVQALLQADQPYIWLFAPNDMIAARGGVLGFDPYPSAPFWNITEWRVIR
jgi:peptide/nickel transport system substrate-binding protein